MHFTCAAAVTGAVPAFPPRYNAVGVTAAKTSEAEGLSRKRPSGVERPPSFDGLWARRRRRALAPRQPFGFGNKTLPCGRRRLLRRGVDAGARISCAVIPAQAGIQSFCGLSPRPALDPRFRGGDNRELGRRSEAIERRALYRLHDGEPPLRDAVCRRDERSRATRPGASQWRRVDVHSQVRRRAPRLVGTLCRRQ